MARFIVVYAQGQGSNLGTIPREFAKTINDVGIGARVVELQKAVVFHSARILRKVF